MLHAQMQEVLLRRATAAGAEVHRGTVVRDVTPGAVPSVVFEHDGTVERRAARLVVGADGRASMVRKWAGFAVNRDPGWLLISGLLFVDMDAPPAEASRVAFNPAIGHAAFLFPQGDGRVRAYLISPDGAEHRLQGERDVARFIALSGTASGRPDLYEGAQPAGPLATFSTADTAVDHPYRDGIAVIGDAAASTDPTFGQGLSLTLRDVRVLRDCLLANDDWAAAAEAYATEHDRYYPIIHQTNLFHAELFLQMGEAADERRMRVLSAAATDSIRLPDHHFSGPDEPFNAAALER
jgi:2-polyprenyl-6-methoxyphenol hydroxylase-like FAD-dependent oxidoreductase